MEQSEASEQPILNCSGLGYYTPPATDNFDTPVIFACVIFLTLMGIIFFYALLSN